MPRCPVWYMPLQASALEFKCMNRPDGHCRKLQIPVVINGQRRVVAEALVFIDGGLFRRCGDAERGDVVIDAPPHILGPGLAAVAPHDVLVGLGVDGAEDIDKPAFVDNSYPPGAFFAHETCTLFVSPPVFPVDFLVLEILLYEYNEL